MTYQIFQILNLSEDQFGDIVKAKMKEALDEARKIEIKRAIKMDKRELEETLQLTRQQVHNWYIKKTHYTH
jgi:hypothetical protein